METSSELQQNVDEKISKKVKLKLVLKFALVAFVFWLLFKKGMVTSESIQKLVSSPVSLAACIFLMFLNTLFGVLRWQLLLRTQGAILTFTRTLHLNLIGAFFNIALPGAVSGDFVKAVYAAKSFKNQSTEHQSAVFGSIMFDRILGVSAMVFVASFSIVLGHYLNWGGSLPPVLEYSIGLVGMAMVFFYSYLFLSHKRDPLFTVLQWVTKRHTRLAIIDRIYLGVMAYRAHPKRVFKAIALSVVIHSFVVVIAFLISVAISPVQLPLVALAVVVPIGMLATSVPVLPAGVGTGHAAFYALFKLIGSDQGAEVFSWIVLFQVMIGIWGGVTYLRHRSD